MSKCALDIRKDIVNAVGKKLTIDGAIVDGNVGYFPNPNKASSVINAINKQFNDPSLVQESEKGSFTISPSEELVGKYLNEYNRKKEEEARLLQEEEIARGGYTEEERGEFFQLEGTETSKASPQTIAKIKNFLGRIGVDVKSYDSIVINGVKQNANAAALITQKLIQIVNGKEGVALTEESMHFAVEIIKQTNPALYNKLLKEINSYQLYKQVLADYGADPLYQTPEGKPDIRKLKDEAIAKVLSETVVNQNEGSIEKPENLARVESWWTDIVEWLKNLFNIKSGFDEAALKVLSGEEIGTADDIRAQEGAAFLQKTKQEDSVDRLKSMDSRLSIKDVTTDGKTESRYFLDGTLKILLLKK